MTACPAPPTWGYWPMYQTSHIPYPGDVVLMPVVALRFTHDKIRPVFRKGKHRGQPIYELVNDLFRRRVDPTASLPPLEIYFHNGFWRSLNNRRLWALKAYMGLSGDFQLMVRAYISRCTKASFLEKNSTHTDGLSVEITGDEAALQEVFYKSTPQPCRYFQAGEGECLRGDSCPFAHEDPDEELLLEDQHNRTAARRLLTRVYAKCLGQAWSASFSPEQEMESETEGQEPSEPQRRSSPSIPKDPIQALFAYVDSAEMDVPMDGKRQKDCSTGVPARPPVTQPEAPALTRRPEAFQESAELRSVPEPSRANNLGGLDDASSRPNAVKQRSRLKEQLERKGVEKGRAPQAPTPLSSSSAPFRPSEPRPSELLRHPETAQQDRVKPTAVGERATNTNLNQDDAELPRTAKGSPACTSHSREEVNSGPAESSAMKKATMESTMEDIAEAVSLSVATSLDIGLFSASSAATPSLTIPPSPPPPPLAVEHYTNPIPPPPVAPPPQPSNSGLAEALLPAYMQPDVSPQPSQPVLGPTLGPLGPDLSARPSGVLGAPGPALRQSTPPSPVRLPSQLGPLGPQPMGARAPPGPPSQEPQSAAAQLFALPALFPDHAQLLAAPALGPDDRLPQEEAASGEASEVSYSAPSASLQRQRSPVEVDDIVLERASFHHEMSAHSQTVVDGQSMPSTGDWPALPSNSVARKAPRKPADAEPVSAPSKPIAQAPETVETSRAVAAETSQKDITSLLVKNLPSTVLQRDVLQALREDGFDGKFDYCSLPADWKTGVGRGQAWLNFRSAAAAAELKQAWHGSRRFAFKGQDQSLQVVPSHQQGLQANLRRCTQPSHPQAKVLAEPPFVASSSKARGGSAAACPAPPVPVPAPTPSALTTVRPRPTGLTVPPASPQGPCPSTSGERSKASREKQERRPSDEGRSESLTKNKACPKGVDPQAKAEPERQETWQGDQEGEEAWREEEAQAYASNNEADEGQEEEADEDDMQEDDGEGGQDEAEELEEQDEPDSEERSRSLSDTKSLTKAPASKPCRSQRRSPKRRKDRAAKGGAEDFDQVLAEERSRWAWETSNAKGSPEHCCLCNKPVPNLKYATELGVCKGHYRMLQAEERALASFSTSRQQSDPRAPTNNLFHLSAYLDVAEESALITDLYLGGGINQLTALIRLLVLKGHSLQDRWHGLTAPFMSFVLMEYAPFLALAFADVLDAENQRPDIAALRVRARAAMVNWSPSRRLTSLTGETLEQTLADAVSASQDISLPPEHMPVDSTLPPKRKKKKKAATAKETAAGVGRLASKGEMTYPQPDIVSSEIQERAAEELEAMDDRLDLTDDLDADDIIEDAVPLGPHRVWTFLTCEEVQTWAMASRTQARIYSKATLLGGQSVPPSWSFLQDPADLQHLDFLTKADLASLWDHGRDASNALGQKRSAEPVELEVPDPGTCSAEEEEERDDYDDIDIASDVGVEEDAPVPSTWGAAPVPSARSTLFGGLPPNHPGLQGVLALQSSIQATGWPLTLKTTLRKLAEQVPGLPAMHHPHPRWPHASLVDSFSLSACSKFHSALFEEAAAAALLQLHKEMTEGTVLANVEYAAALTEPAGAIRSLKHLATRLTNLVE